MNEDQLKVTQAIIEAFEDRLAKVEETNKLLRELVSAMIDTSEKQLKLIELNNEDIKQIYNAKN